MSQLRERITKLAELMDRYGLAEAEMSGDDWKIEFARFPAQNPVDNSSNVPDAATSQAGDPVPPAPHARPREPRPRRKAVTESPVPRGTPVSSPMMGIFYTAPSPGSPPFAKEGDLVQVGQVVGLIEAMKVFNEITAPVSGTVQNVVAKSGELVQAGDPLLFIA